MLLFLVARNFLWIGFHLVTLSPQLRKRLLLILSSCVVFHFSLFHDLTKENDILQNPDASKAAWKLLKVGI